MTIAGSHLRLQQSLGGINKTHTIMFMRPKFPRMFVFVIEYCISKILNSISQAVLAAHGYKEHEGYDPVYRLVSVPKEFLPLVIPRAEEILATVQEAQSVNPNLQGCVNYWTMIIQYRAVFFQVSNYFIHLITSNCYPDLSCDLSDCTSLLHLPSPCSLQS